MLNMKRSQIIIFLTILIVVALGTSRFLEKPIAPYRYGILSPAQADKQMSFLEHRLAEMPRSPQTLAMLAAAYVEKGKLSGDSAWFDKATDLAKDALRLAPNQLSAKFVLADLAQAKHQFRTAIELGKQLLAERPDFAPLPLLITSHLALGELEEAGRYADSYVDLFPRLSSYTLRALVYEAKGKKREALYDFQRALAVEDIGEMQQSAQTRIFFGRFYLRQGRFKEARQLFKESLRIIPGFHTALGYLAELETQTGEYDEAIRHYRDAFESSKQTIYITGEARAKVHKGKPREAAELRDQAEKILRNQLKQDPNAHRLELAKLLIERGERMGASEAVALAREELAVRHNSETFHVLGWALLNEGKPAEARKALREALRTGAEEAEYFYRAGLVESALKDQNRAKFFFSRALEVNPRFELSMK